MGNTQKDPADFVPSGEYTHRLVIIIRDDALGEVDKRLEDLWDADRIAFVEYSADHQEQEVE